MANGEDRSITCVDCGEEFIFTAGEQAFYQEKGLTNAPTRCKSCREKRKGERGSSAGPRGAGSSRASSAGGGSKEMHATVCSNCGAETLVPFVPTGVRPVYCRDCFSTLRGDRPGSGPRAGAPGPRRDSPGGRG
ncbi:MAG: zinc-ribbon domain containing protein [Candidatus Eisenbacteria bacterium]|nr:zinc-ribbon domain containing protein [Candidatus Eisenbacteria bacterium]